MEPQRNPNVQAEEIKLTSAGSWAGTLFFCAFAFVLLFIAVFVARDFMFILIAGFFAACGVGGIVMMVRASSGLEKFGDVPLLLGDPWPAVGGKLKASLRLPEKAAAAGTIKVELTCYGVKYGDKNSRSEEPLWGHRWMVPAHEGKVAFEIDLPDHLPPGDDPGLGTAVQDRQYGKWEVKASAEVEGLDFSRSYVVAVGAGQPGMARATVAPAPVVQEKLELSKALPEETSPERKPEPFALWLLVAANLVPVAGALFWGWRVQDVVFLYWVENVIIGAFNVLRIMIAVPETVGQLARRGVEVSGGMLAGGKAVIIGFFIVHYGGFCFGHGELLAGFFTQGPDRSIAGALGELLREPAGPLAILAIFASHAYSYLRNYYGRGEYLNADFGELMARPYKRIFVTHIFIIAGGFVLMFLNSPVAAMVLFVALKIGFDVHFHRSERKALAFPAAAGTAKR